MVYKGFSELRQASLSGRPPFLVLAALVLQTGVRTTQCLSTQPENMFEVAIT